MIAGQYHRIQAKRVQAHEAIANLFLAKRTAKRQRRMNRWRRVLWKLNTKL